MISFNTIRQQIGSKTKFFLLFLFYTVDQRGIEYLDLANLLVESILKGLKWIGFTEKSRPLSYMARVHRAYAGECLQRTTVSRHLPMPPAPVSISYFLPIILREASVPDDISRSGLLLHSLPFIRYRAERVVKNNALATLTWPYIRQVLTYISRTLH
jgi:hypothetical protein